MTISLQEKTLFDFSEPASVRTWNIVNDGVMGGLSSSALKWSPDGHAIFTGRVSLENYGGFASVRATPQDFMIADYTGIQLRIKGDGNKYKFRIRTNANFDGVAYTLDFTTLPDQWNTIKLPFSSFKPTFRGRTLYNVGPLQPLDIRQIGFLIGDKQEGNFALEVDWIKAY